MPIRLSTLLASIDTSVPNPTNASLIKEFYNFMKASNTSESYQKNNLKTVISFVKWLGNNMTLYEITKKEQIIAFLDTKIKSTDKDPDKRWITTWCNTPARQRALVLQGGGALGAYEAGVLEVLCKKLADEDKECRREDRLIFDIVAGTSIGAMNAAIFVSQFLETQNWEKAVERLQKFWSDQLAVKDIPGFELYPFTVFLSRD